MTHIELPMPGSHVHHDNHSHTTNLDLVAGLLSGQISGLIMAVAIVLVFTLFLGQSAWFPVQVIGSAVYGAKALYAFQWPVFLTGLVLHQAGPSLVWGLVFGAVAHLTRTTHGARLWTLALGIGVVSQIVDVDLLIPMWMKASFGHDLWAENVPMMWSWVAHLVFGAGLAVYPTMRKALAPSDRM